MRKFFKWLGIGFVGLIVIGMFLPEDETTTTTTSTQETKVAETAEKPKEEAKKEEPKKEFGVGQEVIAGVLTYKVNGVEEVNEIKVEYLDPIKTTGKFVIVDLTVGNNDKEARFMDGEMLRLVDAEGTEFSNKSEADMYINDDIGFFLAEINPKMTKQGKVAFEVPANINVADLKLQVSSGFGWSGGKYETINLK